MHKYFEKFVKNNSTFITSWESKGLSNEKYSSINTSSFNSSSTFAYDNARIKVKFHRDFLKQDDLATYDHGKIVNIYIVYRLIPVLNDSSFTLKNCLIGAVEVRSNVDDVVNTFTKDTVLDLIQEEVLHIQVGGYQKCYYPWS